MDKKLWYPITCHKPPEKQDEGDYKPSFCDASIPELPPAPPQPTVSPPLEHHFPFQSLPLPMPRQSAPPQQPAQAKKEGRISPPKAYDIAMDLMAQLPLRMVDNALYAFDGQIYRFVTIAVMHRVIMHNCRQHVQAIGDASIIERIYKVIQAEPSNP